MTTQDLPRTLEEIQACSDYAETLYDEGRLESAAAWARRALDRREATVGPGAPEVEELQNLLGIVLSDLGGFEEARDLYARAMEAVEAKGDIASTAALLNNLAELETTLGKPEAALTYLERAVRLWTELHGERHPPRRNGPGASRAGRGAGGERACRAGVAA